MAMVADKNAAAFDGFWQSTALQVDVDVVLELKAGLWAGCLVIEEGEFASAFTDVVQEQAAGSSHAGLVGDGVLPELLLLEEAAVGEAHSERGVDVLYRSLEAE